MRNWKATRLILKDKVREMCMEFDLYTYGDNEEYLYMLNELCNQSSPILEDYERIAENILSHSNIEQLKGKYGIDYDELLESIMNRLVNDCSYLKIELT